MFHWKIYSFYAQKLKVVLGEFLEWHILLVNAFFLASIWREWNLD